VLLVGVEEALEVARDLLDGEGSPIDEKVCGDDGEASGGDDGTSSTSTSTGVCTLDLSSRIHIELDFEAKAKKVEHDRVNQWAKPHLDVHL